MEMNLQNELQAMLQQVLYAVIIAVLPIITNFAVKALNKIGDNADSSSMLEWQKETLNRAIEAVAQSVAFTSQTYVKALKDQGAWTAETQKEAFDITKEKAGAFIDSEMKELIKETYGDFDLWLEAKIEQMVASQSTAKQLTN